MRIGYQCIPAVFEFAIHDRHIITPFVKQLKETERKKNDKKKHATHVKLTKWFFFVPSERVRMLCFFSFSGFLQ